MKLQEIMERTNIPQVGLAKALIKDAIHLIKSSYPEEIRIDKQNIIDGESEYILPYNMIQLKSISIKDTNDNKYKQIRRLASKPIVREDTDPE
jgi:hypothetical protein